LPSRLRGCADRGVGPSARCDGPESESAIASKLVAECGYHKRDEEVAELDAVLCCERRFADLLVHV
jgi:hypothetical protein